MNKRHSIIHIIILCIAVVMCASCGHPAVPENAQQSGKMPAIYPDYTEVTVPSNICPANFMLDTPCEEVVARLTAGGKSYTYGEENKVIIDESEWAELRDAAKGKSISVEVFAKNNGNWTAYKPFNIYVADEEIDPYISYRLIQPSYVAYEELSLAQRNITTFEETDIYNNQLVQTEDDGQCINCHSYQNYSTKNMLFHARQKMGGTMLVHDGTVEKLNLKTDSTLSAGVYPAWHPTMNVIAFSTNKTEQSFHTRKMGKVEVFDTESDLILYDVEKHTVSHISNATDELEVFPAWSADGNTLYYCSAHFVYNNDSLSLDVQSVMRYQEKKYSIYARSFDQKTRKFGEPRMIFDAAAIDKSATLPRISPDGRYMAFSIGNYGCFHVWHREADIMIMDLKTNALLPKDAIVKLNSKESESYPTFSSNGRWIMTASRRDDGNFTRPYIAYFDKNGKCHKAFEVPQKDPEYNRVLLKSYNRPEFMKEPVGITPQTFAEKIKGDATNAVFAK